MFALHSRDSFLFRFFLKKANGVWGNAPQNSVFFLIAFSFALTVSKEKAAYGLDFITNQIVFLKKQGRTPDEGSPSLFALQINSPSPAFFER